MLRLLGIEARPFFALVRAFVLMDLRGQHFAASTASRASYVLSPLFIVVGQLLASSALLVVMLYGRGDVWFFSFVNLTLAMLFLLSTIVVEIQEIALNPDDLMVLGPRPIAPRTYAAARVVNLLFFYALMFLALTILPAIAGATLRDAGPWFAPAYVLASLSGGLVVLTATVIGLSFVKQSDALNTIKIVLSWAQILVLLFLAYAGQALLFGWNAALAPTLLTWGAFPPAWVDRTPTGWLARFVERAACEPDQIAMLLSLGLVALSVVACVALGWRLTVLYGDMRPVERAAGRTQAFVGVGKLPGGWFLFGAAERVGYWLGTTFLRRDPGLALRCLFAFQFPLAVGIVGFAMRQLGNPLRESDPTRIGLTILALFLIPLAAPNLVYNLSYCRDSGGGWLFRVAPVPSLAGLARGACKAAFLWVVLPLCVVFGLVAGIVWQDGLSAVLHTLYLAGLTWVFVEASLGIISPSLPFSLPPARGGAMALPPLPMALLSTAASLLGAIHLLASTFALYWVAAFLTLPVVGWMLTYRANTRLARLGGAS